MPNCHVSQPLKSKIDLENRILTQLFMKYDAFIWSPSSEAPTSYTLSWTTPSHTICEKHFNIIFPRVSRYFKTTLLFPFSDENPFCLFIFFYACYMLLQSHSSWFIVFMIYDVKYKSWSSSFCNFLHFWILHSNKSVCIFHRQFSSFFYKTRQGKSLHFSLTCAVCNFWISQFALSPPSARLPTVTSALYFQEAIFSATCFINRQGGN